MAALFGRTLLVLLGVLACAKEPPRSAESAASLPPKQDSTSSDPRTVKRIPPAAFDFAPDAVREELDRRGCSVPQVVDFTDGVPENVISGKFTSSGTQDWAALCSIRDTTTILVFRGGKSTDVIELSREPDVSFARRGRATMRVFSREIATVNPETMRKYAAFHKDSVPAPLDHDGIEDSSIGKASVIHYWHRGQWITLRGAS